MTSRSRLIRHASALRHGLLIANALVAIPGRDAHAATQTVGVGVTFIERIEIVARSSQPPMLPDSGTTVAATGPAAPVKADRDSDPGRDPAVAVLSVKATPGRAMTVQIDAPDAQESTRFHCRYAALPLAPCSGDGLTAVSAADTALTISRAPRDPGEAVRSGRIDTESATIEVTIAYQ